MHSFIKNGYLLQVVGKKGVRAVNQIMVLTNFEIGRMIVEEEQNGKDRAGFGKHLLKEFFYPLTKDFGRGFSVDNLEN